MKRILSTVFALAIVVSSFAQLSGTYTIGGTTPNFTSVVQAVDTLNAKGVNGAVVFRIRQGTYTGQIKLNSPSGVTATNSVTFEPDTSNTAPVIITFAATSTAMGNRGTWVFNASKHITLDSLTIRTTGTANNGHAIEFRGNGDKITIKNCLLENTSSISSPTSNAAVVMDNSGSANNNKNITIEDCVIKGGTYGLYAYGVNTSNKQTGWKLHNNEIKDWYWYGVYTYYVGLSLNDNTITDNTTNSYRFPTAVRMDYSDGSEIRRNNISLTNSSITYAYGLYFRYTDGTSSTDPVIVANNMVYGIKMLYTGYFYINNNMSLYHNTFKSGTGYNARYTVYYRAGTSNTVKNNIFYNSSLQYAYWQVTAPSSRSHNNFYSGTTSPVFNTTVQSNEFTVDPKFKSATDLHIENVKLNAAGDPVTTVTVDIDGDTRGTNGDIGADEFSPDTLDLKLESINPIYCFGTSSGVTMEVQNYGLDTIKTAKIQWSVAKNGGTPVAQPVYSFSGSVASGVEATWTIGNFTFNKDTLYQIWAYVDSVNGKVDMNLANDSVQTDTFRTALSGIYTIGGTSPDFATPAAAIADLKRFGLCGPTTLKLRSGTYNGQLIMDAIPGLSSANTLEITRDTGSTQPIIRSTMSPGIRMTSVSNISFNNVSIICAASGGQAIQFTKDNRDISIDSCFIQTDTNSTSWSCRAINKDGGGYLHDFSIENSHIKGGYAGIWLVGLSTSAVDSSFKMVNNEITTFSYYGLRLYYSDEAVITDNLIDNTDHRNAPFSYSMYMYYDDFFDIERNVVNSAGRYSLYARYCDGNSSNKSRVVNNMFSQPNKNVSSTSWIYGPYMFNCDHTNYQFNNSLLVAGSANRAYGAYMYGTTSFSVSNNNFVHMGEGFGLYANSSVNEQRNNVYAPNGVTMATGQTQGANGKNVDPDYITDTDLHTLSIDINGAATFIAGITKDIDGDTRSTTAPDLGADEFTPKAFDIKPHLLVKPSQGGCGQDSADFYVIVKNNGTSACTSQRVTVELVSPVRDTITGTATKTIASAKTDTVYVGKASTAAGGRMVFKVITSWSSDTETRNDTMIVEDYLIYKTPTVPFAGTNITVCENIDTTLVATSTGRKIYWYDDPNGPVIHEGGSYKVNINAKDTFWVRGSEDYTSRVGHASNLTGRGNFTTAVTRGLEFDVLKEMTIDTVTVYPRDAGTVTVRLKDRSGKVLQDTSFSVNTSGIAHLPIGFHVDPGTGYELDATGTNTRGLWYNFSPLSYPYIDADSAVFITGDYNGSTFSYYFFYNWKISVEGCESDLGMIPVDVRPSLTVNLGKDTGYCIGGSINFTLNATNAGATSYRWQNNSTAPTFNVTTKGTYWVDVTSSNGCVTKDTIEVLEVPLPNVVFSGAKHCTNEGAIRVKGFPQGGDVTGPGCIGGLFYPGIAGTGAHTVTYTYTDSIGCANSDVGTIVVDTAPNVFFTPPSTFCQSNTGIALSGGSPAGGYYFGKNVIGNKIAATSVGTDTVGYIYYNVQGCKDSATSTVQIIASPSVNWGPISDVCQNTPSFTLGGTPTGGVYTGPGASGGSFIASQAGPGTHTLNYEVTGANGCKGSASQTIVVNPIPYVRFNSLPSACEDEGTYKLKSFVSPAGGTFSGMHVDNGTQTFNIDSSGAGSHPVTYKISNQFGCVDSVVQFLLVRETPDANLGADTNICGDQFLVLDAKNPGSKYKWSNGDTSKTILVQYSGLITVRITTAGCVGTDSINVTYSETCVSIDEALAQSTDVNIYPNPSNGLVNVDMDGFEGMNVKFTVRAINGQTVFERSQEGLSAQHSEVLDLSVFDDGIYLLNIDTDKGSLVYRITVAH